MADHGLTFGAAVARRTRAFVAVYGVATRAAVFARLHLARLDRDFAMRSVPSFRAFALVTGSVLLQKNK